MNYSKWETVNAVRLAGISGSAKFQLFIQENFRTPVPPAPITYGQWEEDHAEELLGMTERLKWWLFLYTQLSARGLLEPDRNKG